jgi:hypothetical protein
MTSSSRFCCRYFLYRDTDLEGAALFLFLRVVEQCLRVHSQASSSAASIGKGGRGLPLRFLPQCPPALPLRHDRQYPVNRILLIMQRCLLP